MRRFALLALSAACARAPQAGVAPVTDETQVQSMVVNDVVTVATGTSVLVIDSTVMGWGHYYAQDEAAALQELGTLASGLREDFEKKRAQKVPVPSLNSRVSVRLVPAAEIATLPARNPAEFWSAFRARYPGSFGYMRLSHTSFSADRNQALVIVDYACGSRCGGTRYYLLERNSGGWHIARMAQPRIS